MTRADTRERSVGVVGLGRVGTGVLGLLTASGRDVVVFDVDRGRLAEGGKLGGSVMPSNAALANAAAVVLVAVFDDAQVRDVMVGPDGILEAEQAPKVVCVLSTVTLDTMRWARDQAARRDVEVMDCGVAIGRGFEHGSVVATVGGSPEAFAIAAPALETFASPLLHMGPLGAGMQAKLMRNMLQYGLALLGFETGHMLRAAGIDGDAFAEAFRARDLVGPNLMDYVRIAASVNDGDSVTLDAIGRYAVKDLDAALALGRQLDVDLPTAHFNLQAFQSIVGEAAMGERR